MKLILVEDDSLIQLCTQDALENAGHEVFPAANGEDALKLFSTTPGVEGLMVDVRLSGRLNGWDLALRAREDAPNLAIVYTTTAYTAEYRERGVERSVLLQKPYSLNRAVEAMREAAAINDPGAQRELSDLAKNQFGA